MGFFRNPAKATKSFFGIKKPHGGSTYMGRDQMEAMKLIKAQEAERLAAQQRAEQEGIEKQRFSNDELLKGLTRQMAADKSRIQSLDYPVYRGERQSYIPASTERARQLQSEMRNKPIPYTNKNQKLLAQEGKGMSDAQRASLLNMITSQDNAEHQILERLQKQFGKNYGYEVEREAPLKGKIGKDIGRSRENADVNLKRLNEEIALQQNKNNLETAKAFQKAGIMKNQRKSSLINQLEEFGNQESALRNLQNKAKRDVFEEERDYPARKIDIAAKAIGRLGPEKTHPDYLKIRNDELQRIINAYNTPYAPYKGERVIDIQPETQQSFRDVNALSPKHKDNYYDERKRLEKGLMNESLADKTYKQIPENLNPLLKNLDFLTRQQMKKSSKEIAGKHMRLGTYGSGVHKHETEKNLRDILRVAQQEREGALTGITKSEADLASRKNQVGMQKHKLMSMLGTQEFMNILDRNKDLNKLGWTKRANLQDEENQRLRDWYSQVSHGLAPGDLNEYNRLAKQYDTDLTSLFNVPQTYTENKNALSRYRNTLGPGIKSSPNVLNRLDELEEEEKKRMAQRGDTFGNYLNTRTQALARAQASPIGYSSVHTINPGKLFLSRK